MRTTAELHRKLTDTQYAHARAVFLTEQRHGACSNRLVVRHLTRLGARVTPNLLVHPPLDTLQLFAAHGFEVREIEAQSIRRHERTPLLNMVAQFFA